MNFLFNASNLKTGGGLQVADSICGQLFRYPQHNFTVVLSQHLHATYERVKEYHNITLYTYDITNNFRTLLFGRDKFLDTLVEQHHIDCVLTIFGPSRWNPRVPHVSGFAMPHLVLDDSPYFKQLSIYNKWKSKAYFAVVNWAFKRSTQQFYTENEYISRRLKKKWPNYHITTITNYYNQIFDNPTQWNSIEIPHFDGITLLTVSACYPHKNLSIAIDIARILRRKHPQFRFRFIFTIPANCLSIPLYLKEHFLLIGKVDISQCPRLYQAADISFQPTLLECFTATYPESMRMERPIVTTDLEFAKGLCGDAAIYYAPLDANAAAERIYEVATNITLRNRLIAAGKEQLLRYDTYKQRADKIISMCEKTAINNQI